MSKVISIGADRFAAFVAVCAAEALAAESNIPASAVVVPDTIEINTKDDGSIEVTVPGFSVDFAKVEDNGTPAAEPKAAGKRASKSKDTKAPRAPRKAGKVFNATGRGRPPAWFAALSDKDKDAYRKMSMERRKAFMVKIGALKV